MSEDASASLGENCSEGSAGRELLRTDEVAFCRGAQIGHGLKVEGAIMQKASNISCHTIVSKKHMFGDFGLKDSNCCLDDCECFSGLISPVKRRFRGFLDSGTSITVLAERYEALWDRWDSLQSFIPRCES